MATSDLAVEAAKAALEDAGITPDEVDLIILGTDSPDYITPATSVVVQEKLGAKKLALLMSVVLVPASRPV